MYKRILVPTDGSDISAKATATAVQLAKTLGAELIALGVKDPYPYSAMGETYPTLPQEFFDRQERIASRNVSRVKEAASAADVPCTGLSVESASVFDAIIEQARTLECDLIVMASHGRRGVQALLLGSETQKVLTHSTIPVLVVR
ncbi:universal stress protein [Caldimonas tepidiphila]|uniref:universal stress protein n=1 Tax=Caldimonas tepidiphila TaxID=2315841 RepID=UPI000E5A1B7F|nr:universal stress protein [Caldimonas tepidiphila]